MQSTSSLSKVVSKSVKIAPHVNVHCVEPLIVPIETACLSDERAEDPICLANEIPVAAVLRRLGAMEQIAAYQINRAEELRPSREIVGRPTRRLHFDVLAQTGRDKGILIHPPKRVVPEFFFERRGHSALATCPQRLGHGLGKRGSVQRNH